MKRRTENRLAVHLHPMIKPIQESKPMPPVSKETNTASSFRPAENEPASEYCPRGLGNGIQLQRVREQAFTRTDLLVTILAVILVVAGVGFYHVGERGRTATCARNLHVLSEAMHSFANDHAGALPPAGVEQPLTAWNMEILPYGQAGSANAKSPGARKQLGNAPKFATSIFACPSDPIMRKNPRSYAMSAHDMRPENWPPGPDNETGVGLWWNKATISRLLGDEINHAPPKQQREAFALVKLSWIPDPANTLLLTELFHQDNRLERWGQVVTKAEDQVNATGGDLSRCHKGRFNYLMLDGHVELLSPAQTGAWRGDRGIWTIRGGD